MNEFEEKALLLYKKYSKRTFFDKIFDRDHDDKLEESMNLFKKASNIYVKQNELVNGIKCYEKYLELGVKLNYIISSDIFYLIKLYQQNKDFEKGINELKKYETILQDKNQDFINT